MSRNDSREGPRQNPVHRVSEPASVSQRPQADVPGGGKTMMDSEPSSHNPRHQPPVLQTESEIGHQKGPALPVKEHRFAVKGARHECVLFDRFFPGGRGAVRKREGVRSGGEGLKREGMTWNSASGNAATA